LDGTMKLAIPAREQRAPTIEKSSGLKA